VYAHKKGEVVGPAGGETGIPRCLAEVRKPLRAASLHYFNEQIEEFNPSRKNCQIKKQKNLYGGYGPCPPFLHRPSIFSIYFMDIKCKTKIDFLQFFCTCQIILSAEHHRISGQNGCFEVFSGNKQRNGFAIPMQSSQNSKKKAWALHQPPGDLCEYLQYDFSLCQPDILLPFLIKSITS